MIVSLYNNLSKSRYILKDCVFTVLIIFSENVFTLVWPWSLALTAKHTFLNNQRLLFLYEVHTINTFLEPLMKLLKSVSEWQSPMYSSLPTVFVAILKDEGRGNPPKYFFINSLWLSRCCERTFLESCNEVVPEKMRRMPEGPISSHLHTLRPKCRMMMMTIVTVRLMLSMCTFSCFAAWKGK